ncbi:MAG: hypothetical protein V4672_06150 [Verrucomicrobiota bacterium]
MSENEPVKPKKGWGYLQWSVLLTVLFLLASLVALTFNHFLVKRDQMRAASDLSLVLNLMRSYASEFDGHYPDFAGQNLSNGKDLPKRTSNSAFRRLIQVGMIQDERVLGCSHSRFNPDGNIGTAPDHAEAFAPGENHWLMVAGLSNRSPGHYPLILENAVDASWPPRWLPSSFLLSRWFASLRGEMPPRGRSWPGNTILIGFNDGSIKTVKLESKDGFLRLPESILKPEGKEPLPTLKILDIELPEIRQ